MTGDDGVCPDNPAKSAPDEVMRCREIQCGTSFLAVTNIVKLISVSRQE